ncbi:hypothetical protein CONPUDRAFT_138596 [Coniophora puteana RWD-64-598 SS2]|uniref:F-box domain-containing protein n=1 Tax=Coniophora puteana (strain RWD-64-598) TaxID=741705 RepID=A0A5M3MHF7_CONPW|nr:uncharacterized protein CONPUDRAFT_138596 [Coniophora puteana RWD-64-598 SS2]EIW78214.1 hypothetical protein CONPUDRAFT_138596 [Coniophora puteana RWD-64-598 SS2]
MAEDSIDHLLRQSSSIHPPAMALPFELVIDIIDRACAPPSLLDPYLGCGPMSPWAQNLRFQKGLTLVCKSWSEAGKELLYRDVVIRRISQLPLLAHALFKDSTSTLAPMVKKLRLLCYVSSSQHRVLEISLKSVFLMCTRIRHLVFDPVLDASWSSSAQIAPESTFMALQNVPEVRRELITHVELGIPVSLSHAIPELVQFPNLTVLSCELSHLAPAADGVPYTFLQLDDLRITLSYSNPSYVDAAFGNNYQSLISSLRLPALRKVSFIAWADYMLPHYVSFLKNFGNQLLCLVVYGHFHRVSQFEELIQHCPNVEHLVVPHVKDLTTLEHPKVVWLDALGGPPSLCKNHDLMDAYKNLPCLRGVRHLCTSLFQVAVLPSIFPPHLATRLPGSNSQASLLTYPGFAICIRKGLVYRLDLECLDMHCGLDDGGFRHMWNFPEDELVKARGSKVEEGGAGERGDGEGAEEQGSKGEKGEEGEEGESGDDAASSSSEATSSEYEDCEVDGIDEDMTALEDMLDSLQILSKF